MYKEILQYQLSHGKVTHLNVSPAYKEKMKELSVLSLICSCFYPETRNKLMNEFEGMDHS